MKLLFIVVCVIYFNFVFCLWEENAGPFSMKPSINSLRMCEKVGRNSSWLDTKLHKFNETHFAYTGNATINTLIDNNLWIRAIMQYKPKGSNKWNSIFSVNMKSCDAIERFVKEIVTEIFATAGVKYKCPIPKGVYHIQDYVINLDRLNNIPVLPYGVAKCQLMFHSVKRNRKILETCVEIIFEIVPKE